MRALIAFAASAAALAATLTAAVGNAAFAGEILPAAGSALPGEVFRSVDAVGFVLVTLFVVLLGMIIDMFHHIRLGRLVPETLLADVQTEMANGEYEKALELSDKADCLIGQVFSAALSKTDYSFERMADAMRGEVRIQGLVLRQWVSQFRIAAMTGILLGLAGAALEAMLFIHGMAGQPDWSAALASSFETRARAYAFLFALLMGIVMALASLIVSTIASARLEKILLEAERLGEELLDPFRPLPESGEE